MHDDTLEMLIYNTECELKKALNTVLKQLKSRLELIENNQIKILNELEKLKGVKVKPVLNSGEEAIKTFMNANKEPPPIPKDIKKASTNESQGFDTNKCLCDQGDLELKSLNVPVICNHCGGLIR